MAETVFSVFRVSALVCYPPLLHSKRSQLLAVALSLRCVFSTRGSFTQPFPQFCFSVQHKKYSLSSVLCLFPAYCERVLC